MSRDTERLKGSRWKRYLPKGDWKVVSSCDLGWSCTDQYPDLVSSFEKTLAPENLWVCSSTVGVLWCGHLRALFRGLGFRHTLRSPPFLCEYVRLDTQSVGSVTHLMTPCNVVM